MILPGTLIDMDATLVAGRSAPLVPNELTIWLLFHEVGVTVSGNHRMIVLPDLVHADVVDMMLQAEIKGNIPGHLAIVEAEQSLSVGFRSLMTHRKRALSH